MKPDTLSLTIGCLPPVGLTVSRIAPRFLGHIRLNSTLWLVVEMGTVLKYGEVSEITLGNLTYSYDQLGRRTQTGGSFARTNLPAAVTSAVYDAADQVTNWNGTPISYDANGNMLSDGINTFTWNARNQVAALNNVSLQYDGLGAGLRTMRENLSSSMVRTHHRNSRDRRLRLIC